MPVFGGALGDRARDVLLDEMDSAGESDRPFVDAMPFGLGGGRIEPRFDVCGRGGTTMMIVDRFQMAAVFQKDDYY